MMVKEDIHHFGAGPGCLPALVRQGCSIALNPPPASSAPESLASLFPGPSVAAANPSLLLPIWYPNAPDSIHTAADDLPLNLSIVELSHRTARYDALLEDTKSRLAAALNVPTQDYEILFLQGGASLQFSQVIMNLLPDANYSQHVADYFVTGVWSEKAAEDAIKMGLRVNLVLGSDGSYTPKNPQACLDANQLMYIKEKSNWALSQNSSFVYYCDNETIHGFQFPDAYAPCQGASSSSSTRPLIVCDMSSSILSRPVNVRDYGIIFASSQKNLGVAGVTIVIVRKDLIPPKGNSIPVMMDYGSHTRANGIYNTPPVFAIYSVNLMLRWLKQTFGLDLNVVASWHTKIAALLYHEIDASNDFYHCPIEPKFRSNINVVFRIRPNEAMEDKFLQEAKVCGMIEMKGHRSVGGIRVSLYNPIEEKHVVRLAQFMREFRTKHAK